MNKAAPFIVICLVSTLLTSCVNRAPNTFSSREGKNIRQILEHRGVSTIYDDSDKTELESVLTEAIQTKIEFYGVVVDEKNQPIKDYPVIAAVADRLLQPFEAPFVSLTEVAQIRTDSQGRFKIASKGAALLLDVESQGYWEKEHSYKTYYYAPAFADRNESSLPTRSNPIQFELSKKPDDAIQLPVSTGSVSIVPNSSPVFLSLLDSARYSTTPEKADLSITLAMEEADALGRYRWSCEIEALGGGGIQPRKQILIKEAPADGYESSFEFGYDSSNDSEWDHRDERQLFIRTRDQLYAYVTIAVRSKGKPYVSIEGQINPTGARYGE